MSGWYRQIEMGSNLVRISEPHVNPLVSANLWWLRGHDRDLVVDAGLGVVALREEIPPMFERDPLVLLTHSHLDHVGGAHEFRERAAHTAEAAILGQVSRRAFTARSSTRNSASMPRENRSQTF
jgi:glyoxylase-like metal-dependent hydrolase (beta-lactamase superfamily II)